MQGCRTRAENQEITSINGPFESRENLFEQFSVLGRASVKTCSDQRTKGVFFNQIFREVTLIIKNQWKT